MNLDLAIIGQGAVTPAGIGIEALIRGKAAPESVPTLGNPEESWPVMRVSLKDPAFARWQREPRLRRASPVSFYLVEAAEQALAGISAADRAETGLIVAYSAGCLVYSRRFFEGMVKQGQRTASPALFPETVFNSPMSHVASVLGLNGAAYALVGDESAWITALITASVWLREERVKQAVVLGAEEFDAIALDAYRSVRWLRQCGSGFITSEGAAGLLVAPAKSSNTPRILRANDGFIYRTKSEAADAAAEMLKNSDPALPIFRGAGHNWLGTLESTTIANRPVLPAVPYLGEANTASTAWNTLRALAQLSPDTPRLLQPVWGQSHQFGLLELGVGK